MKISARNEIRGRVTAIHPGAGSGSVKVGNGTVITANITEEAIANLGLQAGASVTAFIEANDVMIGK